MAHYPNKMPPTVSAVKSRNGTDLLPVFSSVFTYMVGEQDGYKILYNASLVCKAFTPRALDMLWRVLPDLNPLYRLLPSEHTYEIGSTAFDWTTFDLYGRRVQRIYLTSCQNPPIMAAAMLPYFRRPSPLLPNLLSLHIDKIGEYSSPFSADSILQWIPPSLTSLSLKGVPEPRTPSRTPASSLLLVFRIAYCTDSFTDLRISAPFDPQLWGQIPLFKNLKRVSMTVEGTNILPLSSLQLLASIPSLISLQLSLESPSGQLDPRIGEEPHHSRTYFARLKILRLSGCQRDINIILRAFGEQLSQRLLHTLELTYTRLS